MKVTPLRTSGGKNAAFSTGVPLGYDEAIKSFLIRLFSHTRARSVEARQGMVKGNQGYGWS